MQMSFTKMIIMSVLRFNIWIKLSQTHYHKTAECKCIHHFFYSYLIFHLFFSLYFLVLISSFTSSMCFGIELNWIVQVYHLSFTFWLKTATIITTQMVCTRNSTIIWSWCPSVIANKQNNHTFCEHFLYVFYALLTILYQCGKNYFNFYIIMCISHMYIQG